MLWQSLPRFLEDDTGDRLFLPLKSPLFADDHRQRLERIFSRALNRYFPGMEHQVKQVFFGGTSQTEQ